MNNETPLILCAKPPGKTIGKEMKCECGEVVWLSDSSITNLEPGVIPQIICFECFVTHMKDDDEITILPPTDSQINEISKHT